MGRARGGSPAFSFAGYGQQQPLADFYFLYWPLSLALLLALQQPALAPLAVLLMLWQRRPLLGGLALLRRLLTPRLGTPRGLGTRPPARVGPEPAGPRE
jgi:hypothetical protein